ncbi:MAG: hypothetical protein A2104_10605 [Candidatus Melainabacteria bacterium GWF2_32_7]|nr:MAG: hypothetical protein A2104_10605 [Candidatus Melainabacteria bacterium GWF2_32_7]
MTSSNIKNVLNVPMRISVPEKKSAQSQNTNNIISTFPDNQKLVKPSIENIKANYISFTGGMYGKDDTDIACEVITDTGVKLNDVGGIDQVKDIIENRVLKFIKEPERFREQGANIPKGVLLYGPPGTGKTLLAKAIAGEAEVPFIPTSGSEFINTFVGKGAANVRKVFDFAREQARMHPSKTAIVFIDEFDALAKKRGGPNEGSEDKLAINQLLTEMDGFAKDKDVNIIVMAATNRLDILDEAVTREGRFDYKIEVPNPARNIEARKAIAKIHSRNKKFESEEGKQEIINKTANITKGLSGAQIAQLMNRAANYVALRDDNKYITMNDIRESHLETIAGPKLKTDTPEWEKEGVIAHECGHALIGQFLSDATKNPWEKPRENSFITLEERGNYLGAVFTEEGENPTMSFSSLIANTSRMYGGYFVEKMKYGSNLAGVSSDLENATNYVTEAVTKYGLGPNTSILATDANPFAKEAAKDAVAKDIKIITTTAAKVAKLIIESNKDFIEEYANSCKNNPNKNISGAEFANMLHDWNQKHYKESEVESLQNRIKRIIDEAQKGEMPNN